MSRQIPRNADYQHSMNLFKSAMLPILPLHLGLPKRLGRIAPGVQSVPQAEVLKPF
jgi:hypothetical protein